jgi:hypothetical protein
MDVACQRVDLLPVGLRGALDRHDVQASRGPQSVTDGPALTAHIPADLRGLRTISARRQKDADAVDLPCPHLPWLRQVGTLEPMGNRRPT